MSSPSYAEQDWLSRPTDYANRALAGNGVAVRTAVSTTAQPDDQAAPQPIRRDDITLAPGRVPSSPSYHTATGRTLLVVSAPRRISYMSRAISIWPRLDRVSLRRCAHDPQRMAAKISRRTSQPLETIMAMLTRDESG